MFEDVTDEEIKKKKQRVVIGLLFLFLLLLGITVILSRAELLPFPTETRFEAGEGLAIHTATPSRPTPALAGMTTSVPTPTITDATPAQPTPQATATSLAAPATPTATDEDGGGFGGGDLGTPTATEDATGGPGGGDLGTPTTTEEATGGFGGGDIGTPTLSPTTVTPDTPVPSATASVALGTPPPQPTATLLVQLPAAGADTRQGPIWLMAGLSAILLGTLLTGIGQTIRRIRNSR
jgi:hypothetical protein